jgi:peptidoglycan/xylan/chitin deacetylase (PgdA/CDA1 family)
MNQLITKITKMLTKLTKKALDTLRHPIRTLSRFKEAPVNVPPDPKSEKEAVFLKYGNLARQQGFDHLYIALSFDCDTPEDIPAAEQVFQWLSKRGLKATFAVPGVQLLEGAQTYHRLLSMGADFINHGARPHTEWRNGRYWSVTFYNEMTPEDVVEDIRRGHEIVQTVLGYTPVGFRAPHFGYFQEEDQRGLIYETLRQLGYRYDTSTLPQFGLNQGPFVDVRGLYEVPLCGSYADPYVILDSWNYIYSPYYPVAKRDYASLFIETVDRFLALDIPGVLNYYVDPAHVFQSDAFYSAIAHVLDRGLISLQYNDLFEFRRK